MSQINMVQLGLGAYLDGAALSAEGVTLTGVADTRLHAPAAVREMLSALRGRVQVVVVDQHHATYPILAMIDWPAIVVLDNPSAEAIRAAKLLGLHFVVSNPLLHSVEAGGWRMLADLVGGPWSAEIEYYLLAAGEDLAPPRGLLEQLVGVAWELLGRPSVAGTLSLLPAADSVEAAMRFQAQLLQVVARRASGPRIAITLGGPAGRVEVCFPAGEVEVPPLPRFWGETPRAHWSGDHISVPLRIYTAARTAQAQSIIDVVQGRQGPLYESSELVRLAEVFAVAPAVGDSPNGYISFQRRP